MFAKLIVISSIAGGLVLGALGLAQQSTPVGVYANGVATINAQSADTRAGRTQAALDCAASPTCIDPSLIGGR